VGGKSPKKENLGNNVKKNNHDISKKATLAMMPLVDTLEIINNTTIVKDSFVSNTNKKEKFVTNGVIREKIQNMVTEMRINSNEKIKPIDNKTNSISNVKLTLERKSPIKKNKNSHKTSQNYGTSEEDVLYFLLGVLLIAIGIWALLAAGVSVAEIIIFGLGFIGVLILLYLLGEAFMNIFPGMSFKK
jgi:hypothetical protein